MRIMVTGGAGFIGSHLTDAFTARGDEVTVADDLSAGRAGRLPAQAELCEVSVVPAGRLRFLIREVRPDLICHLAARVSVRAPAAQDARVNVLGTVNVLEAARQAGARVLLASSSAVYGQDMHSPTPEHAPVAPRSPYGVSKACAEQYVLMHNRVHSTHHGILRLANVYGPRQDPGGEGGVAGIFCAAALSGRVPPVDGDGRQVRDFIYVSDVVAAFLAAADYGQPGTWNIGTGTGTTILELARVISGASSLYAPEHSGRDPGVRRSILDSGRAWRTLRWEARVPLAEGVRHVLRWIAAGMPEDGALA